MNNLHQSSHFPIAGTATILVNVETIPAAEQNWANRSEGSIFSKSEAVAVVYAPQMTL